MRGSKVLLLRSVFHTTTNHYSGRVETIRELRGASPCQ